MHGVGTRYLGAFAPLLLLLLLLLLRSSTKFVLIDRLKIILSVYGRFEEIVTDTGTYCTTQ